MILSNAYCINRPEPMRNQPHPWNLRRIFGRQTLVCVACPSWPEADIATRVIPAQSSRRTFREGQRPTSRLAESDHRGYQPSYSPPATAEAFRPHSTPMSRDSPESDPPDHAKPSQARGTVQTTPLESELGTIFQQLTPSH